MRLLAWAGRILAFLIIGSYPFLTHAALTSQSPWTTWAAILISVQVVALGAVLTWRSTARHRWLAALAGLLILAASWQSAHESLLAVSGVPHALVNLALLILFGSSLLPGRRPLVTTLACRIDPELPAVMLGYTRRVTLAWTVFFAAQLVLSAILFSAAPVGVWSLFVNVLNGPLIALMFLAEYGFRLVHFRGYRHASISQMIQAFTHAPGAPGRRHPSATSLDQG